MILESHNDTRILQKHRFHCLESAILSSLPELPPEKNKERLVGEEDPTSSQNANKFCLGLNTINFLDGIEMKVKTQFICSHEEDDFCLAQMHNFNLYKLAA